MVPRPGLEESALRVEVVPAHAYDKLQERHDLAWAALGQLCQNPDEVGRGCGDCIGCAIFEAAIRQAKGAVASEGEQA